MMFVVEIFRWKDQNFCMCFTSIDIVYNSLYRSDEGEYGDFGEQVGFWSCIQLGKSIFVGNCLDVFFLCS